MQKADELDDLRVRRTRKALQAALLELTVEKGFSEVTVRDLCDRAMVNRSTFYRHYLDKYDLLNQYMDDVQALITEEKFVDEKIARQPDFAPSGLVHLLQHVQQFADFYRVMLGSKGEAAFIQRFRQHTERRFRTLMTRIGADDPNAPPLDMRLSYVSCAGIGAILWWLENDQPCSVEQLARWLGKLSMVSVGMPIVPKEALSTRRK